MLLCGSFVAFHMIFSLGENKRNFSWVASFHWGTENDSFHGYRETVFTYQGGFKGLKEFSRYFSKPKLNSSQNAKYTNFVSASYEC